MNWGKVGRWVLFVGSLLLGLLAGLVGFWVFEAKVPAAMQTTVLATEARLYYVLIGLGLGVVIFLWTLVAAAIAGRAATNRAGRAARTPAP